MRAIGEDALWPSRRRHSSQVSVGRGAQALVAHASGRSPPLRPRVTPPSPPIWPGHPSLATQQGLCLETAIFKVPLLLH